MARLPNPCTSPPFVLEISSFEDEDSRHSSKIMDHFFNNAMTLILPDSGGLPKDIENSLTEQMAYKLHRLPVYKLLDMAFIEAFVKRGSIHVMSCGKRVATHDCAAVTPKGELLLHLTKDTYHELGLISLPQTHAQRKMDIFVVSVNLLAANFHPGTKNYEKTLDCLKRQNLIMDFIISWVPHNEAMCSSSVCLMFAGQCDRVERLELNISQRVLTGVQCPKVESTNPEGGPHTGCHYQSVFDWMGALACNVHLMDNEQDSYASSYTCPRPSVNCPRCCVVQAQGFLTPQLIHKVLASLRKHKSSSSSPSSMTIHGFADSPLRKFPADRYTNPCGSSVYSFLLLPDDKYWLFTAFT